VAKFLIDNATDANGNVTSTRFVDVGDPLCPLAPVTAVVQANTLTSDTLDGRVAALECKVAKLLRALVACGQPIPAGMETDYTRF
jgi:hypothetical protein